MLIEQDQIQGIFRGFEKGGTSFEAEIVVRYSDALNNRPIYGQFILVKLESVNRVVRISANALRYRPALDRSEQVREQIRQLVYWHRYCYRE